MAAVRRFLASCWRSLPRSRGGRLAVVGFLAAVVAIWCVSYQPWRAHYRFRSSAYWAGQLLAAGAGRLVPPPPRGAATGWSWLDALVDLVVAPDRGLAGVVADAQFVPVLEELLEHPDGKVRMVAAFHLSQQVVNGYPRAAPDLMRALGQIPDPRAEPWASEVLQEVAIKASFYPKETRAAAESVGLPPLLNRLGGALFDGVRTRTPAMSVLRAVGPPAARETGQQQSLAELPCYFFGGPSAQVPTGKGVPKAGGNRLPWTLAVPAHGDPPWQSAFDRWTAGAPDVKDVRLVVALKSRDGKALRGGLVWRFRDANNYYAACVDAPKGKFTLYKVVDGQRRTLVDDMLSAVAGETRILAVQHVGDLIRCELDATNSLYYVGDAAISGEGKVGVLTEATARTDFGWLAVSDLRK